jgi:hypothetical protein
LGINLLGASLASLPELILITDNHRYQIPIKIAFSIIVKKAIALKNKFYVESRD